MRMRLAALILIGVAYAPHAMATVGTVTYFGVVANTQTVLGHTEPAPSYDNADLFGGGNLEGDFVTATFTYNTYYGDETKTGASDEQNGGVLFSTSSPLTSATFTVQNPVTLVSYSYSFTPNAYADVYTSAAAIDDVGYSTAGDQLFAALAPATPGPINLSLSFTSTRYGPGDYFNPAGTNTGTLDSIVFDALAVSVSAAPEPASWVLLTAAIGIVGAALRLRRRPNAAVRAG